MCSVGCKTLCFVMAALTAVLTVFVILFFGSQAHAKHYLETNDVNDHYVYTSINFVFDIFLKHYTKKLIEEGKTKLQLEDFERRFATKFLSLDIEGALEAKDGWASDLSTLHRTGDAEMNKGSGDVILTAHLGLDKLHIDFNDYDVSLLGEHQKGKIHVDIGDNSVFIKLAVKVKPKCVVSLAEVKLEKLEQIHVDISNLGIFENLTDEMVTLIVNEVTKKYKRFIEEIVFPELAKAVKDADLCHYLPFLSL